MSEPMKLECNLVTKISKKNEPYECLEIMIGNYKKIVYLEESEKALISMMRMLDD